VAGLVLVALVLFAALTLSGRGASQADDAPPQPLTQPVNLQPHEVVVAGPWILEAARSVGITPPPGVGGIVASINRVGDRVEQGEVLVRLDPEPFERAVREAQIGLERAQSSLATLEANQANAVAAARQELHNARARVETAEREVTRLTTQLALAQRLLELGTESPAAVREVQDALSDAQEELDLAHVALADLEAAQARQERVRAQEHRDAELNVSQAQLGLEEAQENLESLTIVAPYSGIISAVEVSEGSSVSENTVLLTLIDDSVLDMPVQVDETEIGSVAVGQEARVRLDAKPDDVLVGSVTAISPVARLESNIPIFDVTVAVENPDLSVRPGMTAEAEILVAHFDETASLPNAALQQGEAPFVTVVREGEELELPVEVVDSLGFNTIVLGEFQPGDEVVVAGTNPVGANGGQRQGGASVTFVAPAGF